MKLRTKHIIVALVLLTAQLIPGQFNSGLYMADSVESTLNKAGSVSSVTSIDLSTTSPVKIAVIYIAIKDHPNINNEWPGIQNDEDYPNETHPILGTFPDGQLLRDYINGSAGKKIPVEEWYKPQIEEYFRLNSNGKYLVDILFPQTAEGRVYTCSSTYSELVENNEGNEEGMVSKYNNWRRMATEVLQKIDADSPGYFKNVKLINFIYQSSNTEYSDNEFSAFSPDASFEFPSVTGDQLYKGYVTTSNNISTTLHEIFHRIGSIAGSPNGFEGLPDRTTIEFLDLPRNMTWGYDLMCNKGPIPSKNALFAVPPMLTIDRIFLEWIEPDEVITIDHENLRNLKLSDVNMPLTGSQKADGYYRAAKVIIKSKFDGFHDEYFLIEYRAGTNFDRNFYNVYETDPHKGILIWHVKERVEMLNRKREDDHFIDLEVAVPYNGWYGNPAPMDDFPRDYERPAEWYNTVNAAGDFDYLDDSTSPPFLPDGGVHSWELTDSSHPIWKPFFLRRNTLKSNMFTDERIRGVVTDKLTNDTRPSSKDWDGNKTDIAIYNIKRVDDYMTFDVDYTGGVLSVNNNDNSVSDFRLIGNYPNPFNPSTTISFYVPKESLVTLDVYNFNGELVDRLINSRLDKGFHNVEFYSGLINRPLASGIYLYRLSSNGQSFTNKMMLLK